MAISLGHLNFTGRIGDVIYYYVGNEIYVRTVFDGQRKRVMKDERYELFRLYGSFFSKSSKIGSFIYRALGLKKQKKIYNKIVGEAQKFFRHTGMTGEQVLEVMVEKYMNGFEVEVPRENEEAGKTWGLLMAKRKKEEKEREEMINKQKVLAEGCWVNENGEMCGIKGEVETQEMTEMLENTQERIECESILKCSEKEVVICEQLPRKKARILKGAGKLRWKGYGMLLKEMHIDSGGKGMNRVVYTNSTDTISSEEKTLNSV